ncbi:nucleotidyltransferase family protein [Candidatus Desantisbacteria bacterium]|nr:nucleotidyltransferase family protein [Candidatus Desantisbacteria bacterium]
MKALILAGGRGKRLDELSSSKNKCMIMVNGRPLIENSLDYASNTDINEIIIVVGYRAEEIINTYGIKYKNKRLKYVIQPEQRGLVHAMECAKETISGDDFLLLLGDEISVNSKHQEMINEFKKNDIFAICGILWVDDKNLIKKTYTLVQDNENTIYRLVEKPHNPLNNYMGTGNCIFKNEIFNYIDFTPIHHIRKEKEFPDLLQCAIDDGKVVKSFIISDKYINVNSPEDIIIAENFKK